MTAVYLWLGAMVLFGIIEAVTAGIVSIWFCFGSLAALIAAALHASPVVQIIVFLAASALSLIITRPLVRKKILLRPTATNADMLIGERGIVIEDIDNLENIGGVKILGKVWSARSSDGARIEKDSVVTVLKIEGVKLIVELSE